jgi:hypothetical protein
MSVAPLSPPSFSANPKNCVTAIAMTTQTYDDFSTASKFIFATALHILMKCSTDKGFRGQKKFKIIHRAWQM